MKIVRHVARDMRQAMRAIRERLGEDAVILSSRRISDGVEVTAAIDFDAESLEGAAVEPMSDVAESPLIRRHAPAGHAPAPSARDALSTRDAPSGRDASSPRTTSSDRDVLSARAATAARDAELAPRETRALRDNDAPVRSKVPASFNGSATSREPALYNPTELPVYRTDHSTSREDSAASRSSATRTSAPTGGQHGAALDVAPSRHEARRFEAESPLISSELQAALLDSLVVHTEGAPQGTPSGSAATRATSAAPAAQPTRIPRTTASATRTQTHATTTSVTHASSHAPTTSTAHAPEHAAPTSATHASTHATLAAEPTSFSAEMAHAAAEAGQRASATQQASAPAATESHATAVASPASAAVNASAQASAMDRATAAASIPASTAVTQPHSVPVAYATQPLDFDLTELADAPQVVTRTSHRAMATDVVGAELKNLRRMLETQLAQLAWNDMTRRAPIHTEMLRELSEIGIAQDLATQITQQLPQDVDLTYARRFSIAALSQYLLVTGDRWLDNGGRIAFIGSTGVGKTMTLSKLAVRWVLRHGPRDVALVGADNIRLGAQDQMRALGQLLGVPVYTPENFETLPTLLSRLQQRFILIDTPGSSLRDTQLSGRLAVLASSASQLQTALVLAASTQAGSLEEVVKRFAPANPCCCVLTKVDEAASLGGALSVLIRARVPVSYVSEGQRVPEDLRPARALELVSHAVRLAKATGAAADEDLLRRRFGKIANALT